MSCVLRTGSLDTQELTYYSVGRKKIASCGLPLLYSVLEVSRKNHPAQNINTAVVVPEIPLFDIRSFRYNHLCIHSFINCHVY